MRFLLPFHAWLTLVVALFFLGTTGRGEQIPGSPVPAQEPLSSLFTVAIGQTNVPVYEARIDAHTPEQIKVLGAELESGTTLTAFASFDITGSIQVSVSCPEAVQSAKLLPSSSGIVPVISGNHVTFTISKPGQLTLEVNGNWLNSLQLFANPPETNPPRPGDPNVIYYGPGVHEVESVKVTSGKTVYLAAGAVVYGKGGYGNPSGAIFLLDGKDITLRGRGIIDGSRCPWHTRPTLVAHGTNIRVEGITIRDSSGWSFPVQRCEQVDIQNIKIFGWRGNSDGIDICNSRHVEVSHCYLRTFDDLVVLKTEKGQGSLNDVRVHNCVLWNPLAHALSLGAELREPLENVVFSDCDIIHDKGREWLLRVYNCDSAPVKNIVFDNIRIEEARRLMCLWIGKAMWSKEAERGHIDAITFRNISSVASSLPDPWVTLLGFDAAHAISGVQFQNVQIGGQPLKLADIQQNAFVQGVSLQP